MRIKMPGFILFLLICLACLSADYAVAETLERSTPQGFAYSIYLPSAYNNSTQKLPLIIAFHWSTGRGSDMIERWQEPAEKRKYIVVCPNSRNPDFWDYSEDKDVFRMMEEIGNEYNIDTSKIYLTGFSGGGMFTYYLGLNHPDRFRAIAVFAGSLRRLDGDVRLADDTKMQVPVLILHGVKDTTLDIEESEFAALKLKEYRYPVKFIKLSGLGHEYPPYVSWAIMDWFEKLNKT